MRYSGIQQMQLDTARYISIQLGLRVNRWGLCPRCPGVGRCLSGVNRSSSSSGLNSQKQRNTALTLAHAQTILYT